MEFLLWAAAIVAALFLLCRISAFFKKYRPRRILPHPDQKIFDAGASRRYRIWTNRDGHVEFVPLARRWGHE